MEIDFLILPSSDVSSPTVPCAIRLKAPENVSRVPTHIILLIDVSESMMEENKLANVKQCVRSIVNVLNDSDTLSLITFGETADIHLKQVPVDQVHKELIHARIDSLQVNGCTNLSAGLGLVQEVCAESSQKTGLLLLTDGNANRGVSEPSALRELVTQIHQRYETLSIHCVGYGHDHNAELLQGFAESVQGSYNVVNTIEDTAFAFGETLGGLMSCAFQNVTLTVPGHSIVHGPFVTRNVDSNCVIQIGDVYSGTKPLILVDIPRDALSSASYCVTVTGMELVSFTIFTLHPIPYEAHTRQQDVELTRLRYTCTEILHAIKGLRRHDSIGVESITERLDTFANACADPFLDGHPVTNLLRGEIATMRSMLTQAMMGGMDSATNVLMTQHITSIALGRGFSSPVVGNRRGGGGRGLRRMIARSVTPEPEEENPQNVEETQFAFQNSLQSQFASLMREQSQAPQT